MANAHTYPNIDPSSFKPCHYVGYSRDATWSIRCYGIGDWRATPSHGKGVALVRTIYGQTLRVLSAALEKL